ncbi:MAG: enoyl-CoA hydratase [Caulobacteraceae bacterium]|nr:enoyl-CoA hydratase [Caulobacteraceae bacterium]
MEGFVQFGGPQSGSVSGSNFPRLAATTSLEAVPAAHYARGLKVSRDDELQALIVTKTLSGFSAPIIADLRDIIRDVAAGRFGSLKFLAFDFAHEGFPFAMAADGFDGLVDDLCNLILAAPVISVACARADMAGADLEFALACSMFVGERGRRFSFAADTTVSLSFYGLLAMKIGFVQAERLMDGADIIDADRLHGLLLMKEVGEADVLSQVLGKTARRHNSCYGIYRAQRISAQAVHQNLRA